MAKSVFQHDQLTKPAHSGTAPCQAQGRARECTLDTRQLDRLSSCVEASTKSSTLFTNRRLDHLR